MVRKMGGNITDDAFSISFYTIVRNNHDNMGAYFRPKMQATVSV